MLKCCIFWTIFKVLLHFCSWNPPFFWDQNYPVFLDQKYPNLTKPFWTTQTEHLIQIKTKIGFCDLIRIQNPLFLLNKQFSRFDPIRWPKSDQITFDQLAPGFKGWRFFWFTWRCQISDLGLFACDGYFICNVCFAADNLTVNDQLTGPHAAGVNSILPKEHGSPFFYLPIIRHSHDEVTGATPVRLSSTRVI